MAGVAVAQVVGAQQVALAGAGGQTGARPHALDVPDHGRDLGEIGIAHKLAHEADARAAGRGHGAGAGPACADHHADGCQFVLGLDDGIGVLAGLRVLAQAAGVALIASARLEEGVMGYQATKVKPAKTAPRAAAVLPSMRTVPSLKPVMRLHPVRLVVDQVFLGPVVGRHDHAPVQLDGLGLAAEVPGQRGLDLVHLDFEQIGHDAHIDHVGDVLLQVVGQVGCLHQLLHRHGVVLHILPVVGDGQRIIVENDAALDHALHVLGHGGAVHADHDLDPLAPGMEAFLAQADVEPGGQALDIAGEEVFAGDGDAHLVQRADQHAVAGLAA